MFATKRKVIGWLPCLLIFSPLVLGAGATQSDRPAAADKPDAAPAAQEHFRIEDQLSEGSVSIGGRKIDYQAHAGTLVVHAQDWDDVPQNADKEA